MAVEGGLVTSCATPVRAGSKPVAPSHPMVQGWARNQLRHTREGRLETGCATNPVGGGDGRRRREVGVEEVEVGWWAALCSCRC